MIKTFVFLARFLLNSCYYPVFEILIEQENMRVLKQRAVFNLMHAIQHFENNMRIIYSGVSVFVPSPSPFRPRPVPRRSKTSNVLKRS